MPKQIPLEFCVPNPAHPACKECNSPKIDQLKPEEQARLRNYDSLDAEIDDLLFEEPGGGEPDGDEPDEDAFEEYKED